MAADMTRKLSLTVLAIAAGITGQCRAQALTDPTRPPDIFRAPAAGEAVKPPPSRQAFPPVIILSGDRRQVTINGQTAQLGGRIGDAKVIRISDSEVVLQSADSIETIRLYGAIDKKMVNAMPETSRGARAARTEAGK